MNTDEKKSEKTEAKEEQEKAPVQSNEAKEPVKKEKEEKKKLTPEELEARARKAEKRRIANIRDMTWDFRSTAAAMIYMVSNDGLPMFMRTLISTVDKSRQERSGQDYFVSRGAKIGNRIAATVVESLAEIILLPEFERYLGVKVTGGPKHFKIEDEFKQHNTVVVQFSTLGRDENES